MEPTLPPDEPIGALRELVRSGRFAEALQAFREAALSAPRPDALLLAATAATRLGDLREARSLAEAAVDAFRARGDQDGSMRTLNLLGVIAIEQGRLDQAETVLRQALALAHELGDSLLTARVGNNLASLYHLRGNAIDALSLYRGALLAYQRLGDRRGAAETYHNLGLVFRQMGQWIDAEDAASEALRHAELLESPSLLAVVLTGRAEIRLERGDMLVEPELERAARLARQADDELGLAEVHRIRALGALRRDDPAAALPEAEAAYAAATASGAALLRADAAAALALALRRLGRSAEAEKRRVDATETYRSLGAESLRQRFEGEWTAAE